MNFLKKIFSVLFPPRHTVAEQIRADLDMSAARRRTGTLYGAKPDTAGIRRGRELDERASLVPPCAPAHDDDAFCVDWACIKPRPKV